MKTRVSLRYFANHCRLIKKISSYNVSYYVSYYTSDLAEKTEKKLATNYLRLTLAFM